ncbi:lipase family protein [Rhodococcus jostii]|uniref:lipase family protein n=1 Tax=Rhodococcus jostii TaxID=132919 RepID=UPI00362BC38E
MKRHRFRAVTAAAVTLAAVAMFGSAGQVVAEPLTAAAAADFYLPPHPLPAGNSGDLIRSEPFRPLGGSPLAALVPAASATRIMYLSSDTVGAPVAVTGTILEPTAAWSGSGPRPLVSYTYGTIGAGDNCAPSKLIADGITTDGAGTPMPNLYILDVVSLLARGITVVVTDYEGLGTPGAHTYLQPVPEAHAVLDATRAAIRFGAVTPHAPVGIWGYSQGGSAAGGAAQLARSYAPDLNLAGTVVGAPPANVASTLSNVDGKALTDAIGFFLNGLLASHPEFTEAVTTMLNSDGIDFLHRTATECDVNALLHAYQPTSSLTVSGRPIIDELQAHPAIRAVLDSFNLGTPAPADPVLLAQNVNDDVTPAADTYGLQNAWRGAGADVTVAHLDTPPLLPQLGAAGHGAGLLLDNPTAVQWLIARFNH